MAAARTHMSRCTYQVFLSFRGEDTRKTFTNHLYIALVQARIHTFRDDGEIDDEEIVKGENIQLELEKAIGQSRISIIVSSKDYATSSWCLDELVQILDCKKKFGHVILPIFYGIEPSQVRNQTGNLAKAFARQEYALKVARWREALTEVVNLGGMVLQNYDDGEGNTALQIYFLSKLLKSIGVLHRGKLSDANALNSGGSMALDTSYYLPHSEKVDIVTDKILHKPRDTGLSNNSGALHGDVYSHGGLSNRPSYITAFKSIIGFRISLLLTATLFATITYQVPFHLDDSTARESSKHYLIILLNSVVFISSVGVIIFVLHEFPLKPWPHISISVVFGSYMFSLNAIMPNGTLVLLFISIPILLVCFFGKTLWLCKLKFHWNI